MGHPLVLAETTAKCVALARAGKIITDQVWRYAVTPWVRGAGGRKSPLDEGGRAQVKWGSWRTVLDGARDATEVWVGTDPTPRGEFVGGAARDAIARIRPDLPVYRLTLPDLSAATIQRTYEARQPLDEAVIDAYQAEAAVAALIHTALARTIHGGGRALGPAVAVFAPLYGVHRYRVDAQGWVLRSRGPWDGVEVPRSLPLTLATTQETWEPTGPTLASVTGEAAPRAVQAHNDLVTLYGQGLVGYGAPEESSVHRAIREIGLEPVPLRGGATLYPTDPRLPPSEVPRHLYPTYLTLWAQTLAAALPPATVLVTVGSYGNLEVKTHELVERGFLAARVDRPPCTTPLPNTLEVERQRPEPWGLREDEVFDRFAAESLGFSNPPLVLGALERHGYVTYEGDTLVATPECADHHAKLLRCAGALTKASFFNQCEERIRAVRARETDRMTVVDEYRRWTDAITAPYDPWTSKSAKQ